MPIFCKTNVYSLKNTVIQYHLFEFFMKNPLLSCSYLVKKRVTSVKTTLQHGSKKSKGCPFFSDFLLKNLCPTHILSHYVHSLKNSVLSRHFFQFFHEKPCILMPIFGQKNVNPVKTTLYYGLEKSLSRKKSMLSCHAHILSKNLNSLKNTMLPFPYFVKKTSILSKTQCSHVIFFKI